MFSICFRFGCSVFVVYIYIYIYLFIYLFIYMFVFKVVRSFGVFMFHVRFVVRYVHVAILFQSFGLFIWCFCCIDICSFSICFSGSVVRCFCFLCSFCSFSVHAFNLSQSFGRPVL